MQNNFERFLKPVFNRASINPENGMLKTMVAGYKITATHAGKHKVEIPYEFSAKDYLSFLLYIDAEIEHGLMLQYLYAAYSLGGPQVPEQYREKVKGWQEIILGIAKEEMGHFISVQNVLKCIGAPLNFGRMDYPWDTPFYPFPFTLERASLGSIAKYVYAESPENWIDSDNEIAREVKKIVYKGDNNPHRVGYLFEVILDLIGDHEQITDDVFQPKTYPYQAKFDEWGRGYTGGQRGDTSKQGVRGAPDVLVAPLTCRDDAYQALLEISEQGEASKPEGDSGQASHFERFLAVYTEMRAVLIEVAGKWEPSRNVAMNPFIAEKDDDEKVEGSKNVGTEREQDAIKNPEARAWAHLFNVRYRMLLNYLAHSFLLDDGLNSGTSSPRATIINATFGEMYNLRSIATIMVQLPLDQHRPDGKTAGPPFTMPYTLALPMGEHNRWLEHQDMLEASKVIADQMLAFDIPVGSRRYLNALLEADGKLKLIIDKLTFPNSN